MVYLPLLFDDLVNKRIDAEKPREEGLTYVTDRLQALDKESFAIVSSFIDVIKIPGSLALLAPEVSLENRIKFYHDLNIKVSIGSTIAEFAILKGSFEDFVKDAKSVGFDMIEIGENSIDLKEEQGRKVVEIILANDLEFVWKVGKRDPRHQLSMEDTLTKIRRAINLGSKKVILEANQGISVGIYDEKGFIKWNSLRVLTSEYPPSRFIFEAPLAFQQSLLIAEFGERVNLAEVSLHDVASIEAQRRGFLSKATFGIQYLRKDPEGSPAAKFVYYIINTKYPIEQAEIISISHLSRRTVQSAIEELKHQGLIIERISLEDGRKKVYYPIRSDWL